MPRWNDGATATVSPTCWLSNHVAAATRRALATPADPPEAAHDASTTTVLTTRPMIAAQAADAIAAVSVARLPYGACGAAATAVRSARSVIPLLCQPGRAGPGCDAP